MHGAQASSTHSQPTSVTIFSFYFEDVPNDREAAIQDLLNFLASCGVGYEFTVIEKMGSWEVIVLVGKYACEKLFGGALHKLGEMGIEKLRGWLGPNEPVTFALDTKATEVMPYQQPDPHRWLDIVSDKAPSIFAKQPKLLSYTFRIIDIELDQADEVIVKREKEGYRAEKNRYVHISSDKQFFKSWPKR